MGVRTKFQGGVEIFAGSVTVSRLLTFFHMFRLLNGKWDDFWLVRLDESFNFWEVDNSCTPINKPLRSYDLQE